MLAPVRTDAEALIGVQRAPRAKVPAEAWILTAIVVAGAGLRFATLTSQSYWLDEATTAHEVTLSLGALLHQVHVNETTPPLYFIAAWIWAKVFGNGEAGLRSLSAVLGTAVIPITYLSGRELVSRRAGLVAATFAAVSPFMIWYSQEARSYMLFAALSGLSFLFFARSLRTGSTRDIAWWAACSGLAVFTHFFAGFLVAPEGIWLLVAVRTRAVLIADAFVAVAQAAVLPLAIGDTTHPLNWIQGFPLFTRIQQIPADFALRSLDQGSAFTKGLWAALALGLIVLALLAFGATARERRGAGVAAALAACVIVVPIVLALAGADYVVPRNFTPAWIPLAVVLAAACTAWRTLPAGAVVGVVVLGGFIWAQVRIDQDALYQRPDWRAVAAALGTPTGPRAVVAVDDGQFATGPLSLYLPGSTPAGYVPVTVDELDVVGRTYQSVDPRLRAGTRLIGTKVVDDFLVARFSLPQPEHVMPASIAAQAASLVSSSPSNGWVLLQRAGA